MKTVIVQVTKDYLTLTCCEPILEMKDQKKETTVDLSYRFTAPYVKPLDRQYMDGKDTVWEIPKAFATMVNDGLREMKRPEVKEVILLVEEFDLVSAEFQHVRCKKKMLENIAVENLKEVLQDEVKQFSIITTTYGTPAKEIPEMTSKTFGIPKALSTELAKRFSEMGLTLVKITPADIPLLKISREIVYSFNKTVCYMSIDYSGLRVVLVRDTLPLYCHTYHSPIIEAVDILAQDRQFSLSAAIDFIKQNGFDFDYSAQTAEATQRINNLREDLMADVIHNISLVAMSLELNIDQVVLSDMVGFFPRVTNTVKKMGLSLDVDLISDQFNTKMAVPELDIDARDAGFKTGSFILFNNLMNSGDKYKNNLMVGLQPLKEKSLNIGKQVSIGVSIVIAAAVVISGAYYAFLNIQKSMDESKFQEEQYVKAANLLARQEEIKTKLKNQEGDAAKLPRSPLKMSTTLEETKKQFVDKVQNFTGYSLIYSGTTDADMQISVPVSASMNTFEEILDLQKKIIAAGFFKVANQLSVADNTTQGTNGQTTARGYSFSLQLSNIVDTDEERNLYDTIVTGRAVGVEESTEAAT